MKKTKGIFLLAFILQISNTNMFCQSWEVQKTNIKTSVRSICFLDTLNGWATTDSSVFLHTTNSGTNWLIEKINDEKYGPKRIQFITRNVGFACSSLGRLFSTKDGGKTWIRYSDIFEIDFRDLYFIDENEGWAVGERWSDTLGRGMIVHTNDSGKSWNIQLQIDIADRLKMKYFKAIRMKNKNEGYAIAGDYFDNFSPTYVYQTKDGGKSWIQLSNPIPQPASRLKIANIDTLWVDGYGIAPMASSTNGGLSWNVFLNGNKYITAISPQSGKKGWAINYDYSKNSSSVIYTSDRGISWSKEFGVNQTVTDIENKGDFVWIAGTNGLIMRKRQITTSIVVPLNVIMDEFILYANYPNPFNPQTTISYYLRQESDVEIKIYDVLGKNIDVYYFFSQPKGISKFEWNGNNRTTKMFSSGVYFCQVTVLSKNGNTNKKTLKMLYLE